MILKFCGIEITRVILFYYFMHNVFDMTSKMLMLPLVMNMYAIFHTFFIIEVEFVNVKIGELL